MNKKFEPPAHDSGLEKSDQIQKFCEEGFSGAFGYLWRYHGVRLNRFIRGRGIFGDRADDVFQEVGMKAYRFFSRHVVEQFPPTAFKIAKDEIATFYRSRCGQPEFQNLDDLIAYQGEPASIKQDKRWQKWRVLQKHMDSAGVSKAQQTAVILHHLIGYTVKEIALILECKVETIRGRLRYANLKVGRVRRREGAS